MKFMKTLALQTALCLCLWQPTAPVLAQSCETLVEGQARATITLKGTEELRTYQLATTAQLRDNVPPGKSLTFSEAPDHATIRTGNLLFDGLYALAVTEALQNSVSEIKDGAYDKGRPIPLEAFQTGEFWTYVWTRDLAYSTHLALAGFDPERARNSLLFKTSPLKPGLQGRFPHQVIQDTGSGGSYPVSSDRIVWALGASETLKYLPDPQRSAFLRQAYSILHDTLEQDRQLVFDPKDGLYRGEQSFLDWREQSYPGWTRDNVLAIARSKALSVNALNYFALRTAADYAKRLNVSADHARYAGWAKDLRRAINRHFYDPAAGLYSTYLLTDSACAVRAHRYDLLGESLAILLEVADESQARSILSHYPTGPFGPPVVWPQERTVPIYHNQAIWPFVTTYWLKAARQAQDEAVVDRAVFSLVRGAAFNLSNMENFDLVTGKPEVKEGPLGGPVINSRRQVWSVAGYLAMVQDVLFGLESSWEGIRFRPCLTTGLHQQYFGGTDLIELRNLGFCGTRHRVRVHLPPVQPQAQGIYPVRRVELNGRRIGQEFVAADAMQLANCWDIFLGAPRPQPHRPELRRVEVADQRALFGPLQPTWDEVGHNAITLQQDHLVLHYQHPDGSNVVFNIYRDGQLCAQRLTQTQWADPHSADYQESVHHYVVEAVDARTGNASHLSPTRCYVTEHQQWVIPAQEMEHRGGKLVDGHHFADWGRPDHELVVRSFTATRGGHYLVWAQFANGSGPVNTGITCGVKRLEIRNARSQSVAGAGYLIMPQSGNWRRFDLSAPVEANLAAGETYSIRIWEDDCSLNMSWLDQNRRYTAWAGGGETSYDFTDIAGLQLLRLGK